MLILSVLLLLCGFVTATKEIVTVTTFTTTTICPITSTVTSSGVTLTTTKLTTSTITVAVEKTVRVPGPTAISTQVNIVNVTQTLTSLESFFLPTLELTKRITSFATFIKTLSSSVPTSGPNTDKETHASSSSTAPELNEGTRVSSILSSTGTSRTVVVSETTKLSDAVNSVTGSTKTDEPQSLATTTPSDAASSVIGSAKIDGLQSLATTTLSDAASSVFGSAKIDGLQSLALSSETIVGTVSISYGTNRPTAPTDIKPLTTQGPQSTKILTTTSGTIQTTLDVSQPLSPVISGSSEPENSFALSPPVMSLGTLLCVPLTMWSATMLFTVVGIMYGAA